MSSSPDAGLSRRDRAGRAQMVSGASGTDRTGVVGAVPWFSMTSSSNTYLPGLAKTVDESMITGESRPITSTVGDTVVAGTGSTDSALPLEITAVGDDTQLGSGKHYWLLINC